MDTDNKYIEEVKNNDEKKKELGFVGGGIAAVIIVALCFWGYSISQNSRAGHVQSGYAESNRDSVDSGYTTSKRDDSTPAGAQRVKDAAKEAKDKVEKATD